MFPHEAEGFGGFGLQHGLEVAQDGGPAAADTVHDLAVFGEVLVDDGELHGITVGTKVLGVGRRDFVGDSRGLFRAFGNSKREDQAVRRVALEHFAVPVEGVIALVEALHGIADAPRGFNRVTEPVAGDRVVVSEGGPELLGRGADVGGVNEFRFGGHRT